MTPETRFPCAACNALPGEPCSLDCIGLAAHRESDPSVATPDAVTDAHCLVCHAARPAHADRIIARALTVEASKLYARMVTS